MKFKKEKLARLIYLQILNIVVANEGIYITFILLVCHATCKKQQMHQKIIKSPDEITPVDESGIS